jgi:hypothetical protein
MVSKSWKSKVLAFNTTYRNWWWKWSAEHREQRKGRGKGKRQGRGNANGYQPQANGYQPQRPCVIDVPCAQALAPSRFVIELVDVPEAELVEVPEAELVELTNYPGLPAEPPGLEISAIRLAQHRADLLAEHGEAARPFVSSLQSERALLVDLGFTAAPTVAPTVLDSPTESWTTTLDASGNEAEDLFSMD